MTDTTELLKAWGAYMATISDWQELIRGVEAKEGDACGIVYELTNPLNRLQESFAIADMRWTDISEPHYHTNDETEVYFVLQGTGVMIVGSQMRELQTASAVVIPPETIHCVKPREDLVLAVVNTPPFSQTNYVPLGVDEALSIKMLLQFK